MASFLPSNGNTRKECTTNSVLISFREWLHSYETENIRFTVTSVREFSSLSESGFIPTYGFRVETGNVPVTFSSLSESGFIPTAYGQ